MEKVQIQYEDFSQLAQTVGHWAETVKARVARLEGQHHETIATWEGTSKSSYVHEMENLMFPAMRRLGDGLQRLYDTMLIAKDAYLEAEQQAAALFHGGDDGGLMMGGEFAPQSGKKSIGSFTFDSWQSRGGNVSLFVQGGDDDGNPIHPSDISQGNLGDCYLLSSLAGIAHTQPDFIRRAIHDNGDGTYTVTFYDKQPDGTFKANPVTVNADLPIAKDGKGNIVNPYTGVGDQSGGNAEIWPQIMEKAYAAKMGNGNLVSGYGKIGDGGWSHNALESITGMKTEFHGDPEDKSIKDVASALKQGKVVTFATDSEPGNFIAKWFSSSPRIEDGTLVYNHMYYVTGVDEAKGTVTVRNPWGWHTKEITLTYGELEDNMRYMSINPLPPQQGDFPMPNPNGPVAG